MLESSTDTPYSRDDDYTMVDERSVRNDVKALFHSKSMDKMLSVFHQVKSKRDRIDEIQAQDSLQASSFVSMVSSATLSQILLPVDSLQKFQMRCWNAFKKYSNGVGDIPLDSCKRALPAYNLFNALDFITEQVRRLDIESEIQKFQLKTDDTISWSEFNYFCSCVFQPLLDATEEDLPTWNRPGLPSTPYTQLLRKQRTVGQLSYDDMAKRTSTSTLLQSEKVRHVYMPKGDIGSAMCKVVRTQKREHGTSMSNLQFGTDSVVNELHIPLQKQIVSEMVDPKSAYKEKWLKMREQRQQRQFSIDKRKERKGYIIT